MATKDQIGACDNWRGSPFENLIGKTVLAMKVADEYLIITTETDKLKYAVSGDCCSESWFADIAGLRSIVGKPVTAIKEPDLSQYNCDDGRGRQEEETVYGLNIHSDDSFCTVIFRNSSNGYYGGWMECPIGMKIPENIPFDSVDDSWRNNRTKDVAE